jgi:hypothetical protein
LTAFPALRPRRAAIYSAIGGFLSRQMAGVISSFKRHR